MAWLCLCFALVFWQLMRVRTYVHGSGLRFCWGRIAERFPGRTKQAVMQRWKQIASDEQYKEHALKQHGEHKAWDEAQEEQVGLA